MSDYISVIGSYYGLVAITDSELDPNQNTVAYEINDKCIAVVYRGKDGVKDFITKYVIPHKHLDFEPLVVEAVKAFTQHQQNYVQTNFSFFLAYYDGSLPKFYAFWFNNGVPIHRHETKIAHFMMPDDLGNYLVVKTYSPQMSLDEIQNLAGFIALQSVKVLGNDFKFDVVTITEKGVTKLKDYEIRNLFQKQEQIDHKLIKIFSDFFVPMGVKRN